MSNFIFITGGVISGIGKGVTAASIARLLKSTEVSVFMIKMDPYINTFPGMIDPLQHGEVFVAEDGTEADLDLGHYERFTGVNLTEHSSITMGKIYREILENEMAGKYSGKTIQVIPHVVDTIKNRLKQAAEQSQADVIICEIGGTVGDMESEAYLEAIRQLRFDLGYRHTYYIHTALVPYLEVSQELKTKPTQHSVKTLRSFGIDPDALILRSKRMLDPETVQKISFFTDVKPETVLDCPDLDVVYKVVPLLAAGKLHENILKHFKLKAKPLNLKTWNSLISKVETTNTVLNVGVVGTTDFKEAYLSLTEAIKHSGYVYSVKPNFIWYNSATTNSEFLKSIDLAIVSGQDNQEFTLKQSELICELSEKQIPTMLINLGFWQVLNNSEKITQVETTKLVGGREIKINKSNPVSKYFKESKIIERFRSFKLPTKAVSHPNLLPLATLDEVPVAFSNPSHSFFVSTLFHPEFSSNPLISHPLFDAIIKVALELKKHQNK